MWYGKNDGKWDDDSEVFTTISAEQTVKLYEELKRLENINKLRSLLEELFNDKRY